MVNGLSNLAQSVFGTNISFDEINWQQNVTPLGFKPIHCSRVSSSDINKSIEDILKQNPTWTLGNVGKDAHGTTKVCFNKGASGSTTYEHDPKDGSLCSTIDSKGPCNPFQGM